ncbi:hypothetical protein HanIR_Chr02g0059471 [Helianthus annuus]|nr:hypothetical protein HanIR_Chr02g0059471 [Helianthus annuus]
MVFTKKYLSFISSGVGTWTVHSGQTFCNHCHVSIHFFSIKPPSKPQTRFYCRIEFLKIPFSKQFSSHSLKFLHNPLRSSSPK